MIKVCHMTSVHPPEDVRIFHKECVSLAKAGYETYLVQQGESYEKNGVHIVGAGAPPKGRIQRMTNFTRRVYQKALEIDADIYHFHDPELLPYGLKLKKKGKKVIFDSHEHTAEAILEKQWLPMPVRKIVYTVFGRYQSSVCHKLSAVVTVSPHIVEYFSKYNQNTIQVANYPIFDKKVPTAEVQEKRLIFAGGISEQWMHENILVALEKLPDCRYTLCGPSSEQYLAKLKSYKGWQQTDYMGRISHNEVAKQMVHCAVGLALLRPGRNTDFQSGTMGNTKIFEEMMAGLPIVCTNFVLWREFVDRYHCGICVDPENVDEIASAIRYLLDHPEEARRMGENGRRAVKEEFNWGIEEKKLLVLYEEVLSDGCR